MRRARARRCCGSGLLLVRCTRRRPPAPGAASGVPWWVWPLALFVVCFLMGIVAVPAGIGGGTLFVPIVGSFFPFHLDFVRGAGLLVALASALAAGPMLLRSGLGSLRLALPLAVLASATSIGGAMLGLAMPANVVQMLLGGVVLGIVVLMLVTKKSEFPHVAQPDALSQALALNGVFVDGASGRVVQWQVHRTVPGLFVFLGIGVLAGMFGIGAGWANVPALNLLMGAPLKVSAGTSGLVLSLVDSSAAWVYINQGAVLPMIAVPSVVGMMLGARIGARLLERAQGLGDPAHGDRGAAVRRAARAAQGHRGVAMKAAPRPGRAARRAVALRAPARLGHAHRPVRAGADLRRLHDRVDAPARAAGATARAVGPAGGQLSCSRRSRRWAGAGSRWCSAATSPASWASSILAGCSLVCLLALVPLYLRRGDRAFVALCLAEVAVVLLAASGWLTAGH